jgi:hypothetical protein
VKVIVNMYFFHRSLDALPATQERRLYILDLFLASSSSTSDTLMQAFLLALLEYSKHN